jgi:hypothetical protein
MSKKVQAIALLKNNLYLRYAFNKNIEEVVMYLLDTKSFVSSFGLVIDQYCFYQFYERVILKQIFSNIFLRSFTYLSKFID